jgi:uncharacterized membrane protein
MSDPKKFFTKDELLEIELAIKEAEKNTSGELVVHIDSKCNNYPLARAKYIFKTKKLHKTKLRNAVLFYLAVDSRKFAIWADEGINQKVEDNFWNQIASEMTKDFKNSNFVEGLKKAITMAGEALQSHFPYDQQGSLN